MVHRGIDGDIFYITGNNHENFADPGSIVSKVPSGGGVFILAADAGVTKTDLEVWNQHLAGEDPATKSGRLVILNKIDGLWDELKSAEEIEAEIASQVDRENAVFLFNSSGDPTLMREGNDMSAVYVVMPMRV